MYDTIEIFEKNNQMNSTKINGLVGILAVLLSLLTIIIMAELRNDGYNHFHKAISELGSMDAPNKWIFNTLAYIVPGILITIFSFNLLKEFRLISVIAYPFYLLAISGILMFFSGVFPADMENKDSIITILHTTASFGGGLCWLLCSLTLWWELKKRDGWRWIAIITFLIPFMLIIAMSFVSENKPGLSQRIGFMANYLFILVIAIKQLGVSRELQRKLPIE